MWRLVCVYLDRLSSLSSFQKFFIWITELFFMTFWLDGNRCKTNERFFAIKTSSASRRFVTSPNPNLLSTCLREEKKNTLRRKLTFGFIAHSAHLFYDSHFFAFGVARKLAAGRWVLSWWNLGYVSWCLPMICACVCVCVELSCWINMDRCADWDTRTELIISVGLATFAIAVRHQSVSTRR